MRTKINLYLKHIMRVKINIELRLLSDLNSYGSSENYSYSEDPINGCLNTPLL
jgi:hypothetical protein